MVDTPYKTQTTATSGPTEEQKKAITQAMATVPPPSGAITPTDLNSATPLPIVNPNQFPLYPVDKIELPTPLTPTDQEQKASSLSSKIGTFYDSLVGKSAYKAQQEQNFGIPDLQKTQNDLATKLTAIKNEAAAIPLQLQNESQGRGRTQGVLGRMERERLRTNAIAALGTSTLLAATQGAISTAENFADRAVEQKYGPIQEQIDAAKANLELILKDPLTTLQDKNRAEAQLAIQKNKEERLAQAKSDANEIWKLAISAGSNATNFKPSGVYKDLSSTLDAISKAPTKEIAIQIASQTGLLQEADKPVTLGQNSILVDPKTGRVIARGVGESGTGFSSSSGSGSRNPEYAGVIQTILGSGKFTKDQSRAIANAINNGEDPFSVIKNQAKALMTGANQTKVESYETAQNAMKDIDSALSQYYALGGTTNVFSGNLEKVINKLGEVNDPKLVDIATQIQANLQVYRNAVSGTAYSEQEGQDIASIFPGINKTEGLNKAILAGRMKAFDSTIDSAYKGVLGDQYRKLKEIQNSQSIDSGADPKATMTINPSAPTNLSQPSQSFVQKALNWLWGE